MTHTRQTSAVLLLLALALSAPGQVKLEGTTEKPIKTPQPAANYLVEFRGKTLDKLVLDLKHRDPSVVEEILRILPLFGPPAADGEIITLVIELTKPRDTHGAFRDAGVRVRALLCLLQLEISPTDVPRVVNALAACVEDQQAQLRYYAAVGLRRFGEESRAAIAPLARKATEQITWEIRRACLAALAVAGRNKGGEPDVRAVAAMAKGAEDVCADVRLEAAIGLGALGRTTNAEKAAEVEKALKILLRDPDKRVVIWANVSQMTLEDKTSETAVLQLAEHLRAREVPVRLHASRALAFLGPKAKVALDSLLETIQDRDESVALSAIDALVQMEDRSPKVLAALTELSKRPEAGKVPRAAAQHAADALKKGKPKE
jgi:HEAT repeat protein